MSYAHPSGIPEPASHKWSPNNDGEFIISGWMELFHKDISGNIFPSLEHFPIDTQIDEMVTLKFPDPYAPNAPGTRPMEIWVDENPVKSVDIPTVNPITPPNNQAPTASANINWTHVYKDRPGVTVNGGGTDPEFHLPLSFAWSDPSGAITFADTSAVPTSFTAPSTPGNYDIQLTASDSFGLAGTPATVNLKVLDNVCNPLDTQTAKSLFNIVTNSVNGPYKVVLNQQAADQVLSPFMTQAKAANPYLSSGSFSARLKSGSTPQAVTGIVPGVAPYLFEHDGNNFTLQSANNVWENANLEVGTWYSVSTEMGLTETGAGVNNVCREQDFIFRLPKYNGSGTSLTRPVEFYDPSSGNLNNITTGSVKITGTSVNTNLGNVNLGNISLNPAGPTVTDGVISRNRTNPVIVRPNTTNTVRVPIKPAVKNPSPTQPDQDKVEPPKEAPKTRRVWPWGR